MMKKLNLSKSTDELKRLIAENPDSPICVLCGEDCGDGVHSWTFASDISFAVEEILNCDQEIQPETVYTDKDMFIEDLEEDLFSRMCDELGGTKPSDEAFDKRFADEMAKYEPFWEKCIVIYANN